MDGGAHREWLQRIFAAPERLAELLVVTDVYAWKLLRRDQRLARDETVAAMLRMVEAVLAPRHLIKEPRGLGDHMDLLEFPQPPA